MQNTQSFAEIAAFVTDLYQGRRTKISPYYYPIAVAVLAANATANYTQKINGNADFLLVDLFTSQNPPAGTLIQITDSASQESLFNSPVDINTVARGQGTPYDVSIGAIRRLAANSNQVITLQNTNVGGASLTAGYLVLCGVQVFLY